MGLAPLLEPGAPLGPPVLPKYAIELSVETYSIFRGDRNGEGAPWHVGEDADEESEASVLKESMGSPRLQDVMNAFVASMEGGVGLSMLFDCIGILVLEVKLHLEPSLALCLKFNGIQRYLRLVDVEDLTVQRAHPSSNSGAWLVDLELAKEGACTFVFDGTEDGRCEAHYFGGCLRSLVQSAHEGTPYPPPLALGSGSLHDSVRNVRRSLTLGSTTKVDPASSFAFRIDPSNSSLHALNVLTVKPQLVDSAVDGLLCQGIEDFEAEIVAELSKYD